MSEYIVNVPDEAAEYFIARFGLDGTKMMGYDLTGEIVRCRDCKHYEQPQSKNGWNGYCITKEHDTVPDGFCKWGEKRNK